MTSDEKIKQYVNDVISKTKYLSKIDVECINSRYTEENIISSGFYLIPSSIYMKKYYMFYSVKYFNALVRLAIRHEIGHIVFIETLQWQEPGTIAQLLTDIRKCKLFCTLQRFYYWNKVIRAIKIWLGFSAKIKYKQNDMCINTFTYEDVEVFCDWFALWGYKELAK